MRRLVVAPHPDDAELAAATLLGPGCTVLILAWCGLDRHDEAQRAAKVSGSELVTYSFPDGYLLHSPELVAAIEETMRQTEPHVIAGPPLSDEHQDHAAVAAALRSATRRLATTVLEYETPSTPPSWEPDTFLPLTEEQAQTRLAALSEHRSQLGRPYCLPDVLRARARYRGQRAGLLAAEAFRTVRRVRL